MPTYITLTHFTDQGARAIKESPDRFEAFKSMAEAAGVNVKSVHWTAGAYDMVLNGREIGGGSVRKFVGAMK